MTKEELKSKIEEWASNNLFNGTSCVETPFERSEELLESLYKHLEI